MAVIILDQLHMSVARIIKLKASSDEIVVAMSEEGLEIFPVAK